MRSVVAIVAALASMTAPAVAGRSPAFGQPVSARRAVDPDPAAGLFVPLSPARILDTRDGLGGTGPVPAGQAISLMVAGQGGIPDSGVGAVMANVTVTEPSAPGNISVYPSGITAPVVSNLNFVANQTVPNLVVVPLGPDGSIALRNNSTGRVQLIVDIAGYFVAGTPSTPGSFQPVAPTRIADTRWNIGASGPVTGGLAAAVKVTGIAGVPTSGVAAVVANVTVTEPQVPGNISAYPLGSLIPAVSNLNFVGGQTVPNLVTVPVGIDGKIVLGNNSAGPVHLIVDIAGYFLSGYTPAPPAGAFAAVLPQRIIDTRSDPAGALGAGESRVIYVAGTGGVPASGAGAVIANVTVTEPGAAGNLTVYPFGDQQPASSNLNYVADQTVPNLVGVKLGSSGAIVLTNNSPGPVHVIIDVAGYFSG